MVEGSKIGRNAVLSQFFQRVADAFLTGDHEWLSTIYTYPLVVYIEGEIFLERTKEETIEALFERRETALLAGTTSIDSIIREVGMENSGRFPVRVDWQFRSEADRIVAENELQYFCRFDRDGRVKIEILEFLKRGFPEAPERRLPQRH